MTWGKICASRHITVEKEEAYDCCMGSFCFPVKEKESFPKTKPYLATAIDGQCVQYLKNQ